MIRRDDLPEKMDVNRFGCLKVCMHFEYLVYGDMTLHKESITIVLCSFIFHYAMQGSELLKAREEFD